MMKKTPLMLFAGLAAGAYYLLSGGGRVRPPAGVVGDPIRRDAVGKSGNTYVTDTWPPNADNVGFTLVYNKALPDLWLGYYQDRTTGKRTLWKTHTPDVSNADSLLAAMMKDWV